jgi:peptide/nickel transport system substrate-binding protein
MVPRRNPVGRWVVALVAIVGAALCLVTGAAHAEPAKRVYAGVYLHDVTKFEQRDGVFDVDLEMWAKWLGDFDPETLVIANAAEVEKQVIGKEQDGAWHSARWRVRGTLRGEFPVQRFPFDKQTLSVVLELPVTQGELVPDLAGSGMRERFSVTGWLYEPSFVPRVADETYRSDLGSIALEGQPTAVRRAAFEVQLSRPLLTASTKLFLPLLVILLVAVVALFIHPKELEVRASVGVTALLACFAFHFAVSDTMPNVAYITLADVLFLVSYGLTAALLCVSVIAFALHEKDYNRAWRRLDIGALIAFPIVLGLTIFLALHAPKTALAAVPLAEQPRPATTRPLLRLGTNSLTTPSGGLTGRGVYWGTVRVESDGRRLPILVEAAPSIANDSLRFLADGSLEVTWHLRDGMRWSDGAPMTSDDLLFALEVSPDPRIADKRTSGPRDLVVRYADRVAVALESIAPLPRHALKAEFDKGGFEAVREYRRKNVTPSAGPYRVTEFVAEDHVVLETNPHFAGPPPSIARIEIKRFADDAALVGAFESGAIDMIVPNAIGPDAARELAARRPEAVRIGPSDLQMFLHPDPTHPLLSKLDVRRGLLMAFDRDKLRREVFGDSAAAARVSHVPVPGPEPKDAAIVAFDPAAARKLLEQAGAGAATIPLSHGKGAVDKAIAKLLVADAAAVGVTLEPREVPSTGDVYRNRKHGGLVLLSTTGERDSAPEKYWSLPQLDGKYDRRFRGDAYTNEISDLVVREERALYPERREQIRDLLFVQYSKRLPQLPLLFLTDRIVAAPELDGWEEGSGNNFGTTIERWHFAPPPEGAPQK